MPTGPLNRNTGTSGCTRLRRSPAGDGPRESPKPAPAPVLISRLSMADKCAKVQGDMASRSVNKVILVGNLGRDAETKFTPSGVARTTFPIATSRRWKDQQTGEWREETDWHNVLLWRQENLANYLTKGKQVYVEGRLQTRSYDDRDGNKRYITEVVADDVLLLGGRGDAQAEGGYNEPVSMPRRQQAQPKQEPSPLDEGITDDDVPF